MKSTAAATMTASHPCGPDLPDFRESPDVCLVSREESGEEKEESGEEKEETDSTDGLASLVTTAAATWCLHAVTAHKADALLDAFQQLVGTHHTLYEPAPPLSTDLSSRLGSMHTTAVEEGQEEHERSRKREYTYADTVVVMDSHQRNNCQVEQPTESEPSSRVKETRIEISSTWVPPISTSQNDSTIRPVDIADVDKASSNTGHHYGAVIPYFPVLQEILQDDWKDEEVTRVKKTRKKRKGKGSGAHVIDDTFVTAGKKPDLAFSGSSSPQYIDVAPDALQQQQQSHASYNVGEQQTYYKQQDTTGARNTYAGADAAAAGACAAVAGAPAMSQWKFTFSCCLCGRSDTIEEKSACCGTCLVAQNTEQAQSRGKHIIKDVSQSEDVCVIYDVGREIPTHSGAISANSNKNSDNVYQDSRILNKEETEMRSNEKTEGCLVQSSPPSLVQDTPSNDENDIKTGYILPTQEQVSSYCIVEVSHPSAPSDDEESFLFKNLLLPPAVPVSSALKRTSPDAVRLWHLHTQRRNAVVNETAEDDEEFSSNCGNTTEKRTDGGDACSSHTDITQLNAHPQSSDHANVRCEDATYSEDDDKDVFDLLKVVQHRKLSKERRKKRAPEKDIHVRAQLACLVEARETNPPPPLVGTGNSQGDAAVTEREATESNSPRKTSNLRAGWDPQRHGAADERPEAEKLTSAVLNALKKLPKHEREEAALLELLLSWYYAGFFTGRLSSSMCSSG